MEQDMEDEYVDQMGGDDDDDEGIPVNSEADLN